MLTKTGRDLPISEIDAENYIVGENDKAFYHVKIEQKQFDPKSGKRRSIPRIQMFGAKEWNNVRPQLKKQDYDIEVLYDPTEFNAEQEVKKSELKAGGKESKADIEALQKELAELKAAMKTKTAKAEKADKTAKAAETEKK